MNTSVQRWQALCILWFLLLFLSRTGLRKFTSLQLSQQNQALLSEAATLFIPFSRQVSWSVNKRHNNKETYNFKLWGIIDRVRVTLENLNTFGSDSSRVGKSEPLDLKLKVQMLGPRFYLFESSQEGIFLWQGAKDSRSEPLNLNLRVQIFQLFSRVIFIIPEARIQYFHG